MEAHYGEGGLLCGFSLSAFDYNCPLKYIYNSDLVSSVYTGVLYERRLI